MEVATVIDGVTLDLVDGSRLRLLGVLPPGLDGDPARGGPGALTATEALRRAIAATPLTLVGEGPDRDRRDRRLGHLFDRDGQLVAGLLTAVGAVRVASTPDARACIDKLLTAEDAARRSRRGLWADPSRRPWRAADLARVMPPDLPGSFVLVEGWPRRAEKVRGTLYLNFGRDWRGDFTISVSGSDALRFADDGMAPEKLVGRRIRVRGWLVDRNGPMITVDHPEQIEVLE